MLNERKIWKILIKGGGKKKKKKEAELGFPASTSYQHLFHILFLLPLFKIALAIMNFSFSVCLPLFLPLTSRRVSFEAMECVLTQFCVTKLHMVKQYLGSNKGLIHTSKIGGWLDWLCILALKKNISARPKFVIFLAAELLKNPASYGTILPKVTDKNYSSSGSVIPCWVRPVCVPNDENTCKMFVFLKADRIGKFFVVAVVWHHLKNTHFLLFVFFF